MRKVAIIGMSPSRIDAPWKDDSWERWCLAWDKMGFRRPFNGTGPARCFEIHSPSCWEHYHKGQPQQVSYRKALGLIQCPVYMQQHHADIPTSVPYPIDDVIECLGRDYFGSSIAYMLALAVLEASSIETVAIYGVELSHADYEHQRPNLEWLIGRLEGAGVEVRVECPRGVLMVTDNRPMQSGLRYKRYGWIRYTEPKYTLDKIDTPRLQKAAKMLALEWRDKTRPELLKMLQPYTPAVIAAGV